MFLFLTAVLRPLLRDLNLSEIAWFKKVNIMIIVTIIKNLKSHNTILK